LLSAHVLKDRVIQRLSQAEKALAYAVTVDQVKLVMDVSAAQEVFAKRQQLGEEVIGQAYAIKTRALAKLGELLKDLDKAKGGTPYKKSTGATQVPVEPTLADLGITKKVSSVAQQLAALPAATREAIAQRETTIPRVLRERRALEVKQRVSLPDAKYRVIYADPPWCYSDKADEGAIQAGGAERHYPSMTIKELCALGVPKIVESDAVLFLWVTSPLLFECAPVIKAWGFSYKASFVWDKVKHNMGHYNSVRHELLLVCTRGSATPDQMQLFDSVQSVEKTDHSVKPEKFREIIDTLYPHGKRVELFARRDVPNGWEAWGNELRSVPAQ
jgi:N6-adenosine-specific RNA methylase IME4